MPRPFRFRDPLTALNDVVDAGHAPLDAFAAFVKLTACVLSCGSREAEFGEEAARWGTDPVRRFVAAGAALFEAMLERPLEDALGPAYLEAASKAGTRKGVEVYTPWEIASYMCRRTYAEASDPGNGIWNDGPLPCMDPCCGSGIFPLEMARAFVEAGRPLSDLTFVCVDLNPVACDMTYLQLAFWGVRARVEHGSALRPDDAPPIAAWETPTWSRVACPPFAHPLRERASVPIGAKGAA